MSGWVKLLRQLKHWEWYKDSPTKSLFIHLLITANHKTSKWQGIEIHAGQLVVGRKSLSYETGLSEQQIRTSLNKLKSTSELTIKSTSKYSIITITKWSDYQCDQPATEPTINQQSTTNKNDNNIINNNITPLPPLAPQANETEKPKRKRVNTQDNYSEAFNEAWPIYPALRRGAKSSAWKAWQKAITAGYTEQQILIGVKNYAASDEASGRYAKGYPAWLNDSRFTWQYKPVGSSGSNSTRGNSGFDALATAAAKIQESMDHDAERLRQTNPILYYQQLADQSRRENGIAGSLEAANHHEHDAPPLSLGHSQKN